MSRNVDIVVNVRLSSSRCPEKIVKSFGNSTLLDIAIDKLLSIQNASNKYIAAGDKKIIDYINDRKPPGINLLYRSAEAVSAGEHHHSVSFGHYKDVKSDYIMIFNPCLPFVLSSTYDKAIENFKENLSTKSLTSVIKYKDIFLDENSKVISLSNPDHVSTTTAKNLYKMAHAFHIVSKQFFLENGKFWNYIPDDPAFFEIDHYESFDVDTDSDFRFCQHLFSSGWRA